MVDTLECVGDIRSWPRDKRKVGTGEGKEPSGSALRGLGETGGKRKSGVVARLRSRGVAEVEGDDKPGALLCDRFRFARGRLGVVRSGEDADRTIGGGLSTVESIGEGPGISMSGTPRLDLTSR